MSSFWSWYIIIIVAINIVGCVWLFWSNRVMPGESSETTGHKWDGDLEEYNNPLPKWWLFLFYITIVWSIAYLVIYPGLGKFAGTLGWTQISQYEQEVALAEDKYGAFYATFSDMDVPEIAGNDAAMAAAANIFGNNCATCHGSDGRGAIGYPNLTDGDWLYGGAPDTILASISNGRNGIMPPQEAVLGADGVDEVTEYVMSIAGLDSSPEKAAKGAAHFATYCSVCHGADGTGNPMLGAPNLTNGIWLHGGTREAIHDTIANGRMNQMPAQLQYLGEDRARLMAAYVLKLSGQVGD
ncbi:MAG: cytochrome-c oxidase, cbb3-type subunit III [Gammaproteobacteria bacterium]